MLMPCTRTFCPMLRERCRVSSIAGAGGGRRPAASAGCTSAPLRSFAIEVLAVTRPPLEGLQSYYMGVRNAGLGQPRQRIKAEVGAAASALGQTLAQCPAEDGSSWTGRLAAQ